jgi:hypothetical protein
MLLTDGETLKLCPMSRELPSAKGGKQYSMDTHTCLLPLSSCLSGLITPAITPPLVRSLWLRWPQLLPVR